MNIKLMSFISIKAALFYRINATKKTLQIFATFTGNLLKITSLQL
jgi:hypothetical protein